MVCEPPLPIIPSSYDRAYDGVLTHCMIIWSALRPEMLKRYIANRDVTIYI